MLLSIWIKLVYRLKIELEDYVKYDTEAKRLYGVKVFKSTGEFSNILCLWGTSYLKSPKFYQIEILARGIFLLFI